MNKSMPDLSEYYKVDRPLSEINIRDENLLGQTSLELNLMYGWRSGDISNLRHFHALKHLHILNDFGFDLSVVGEITTLESFRCSVESSTPIDFTKLHRLQSASVKWNDNLLSLTSLHGLETLFIGFSKIKTEEIFPYFPNLKILNLKGTTPNSLESMKYLTRLEEFWFTHTRKQLFSLEPLGYCKNIERIFLNFPLNQCLGFAHQLPKLKRLLVEGATLPTIKDLAHQSTIEVLDIIGNSTIEDGDIAVILTLPNLQEGFVRMRRHYNLKGGVFERINGKLTNSKLVIPKFGE